MNPETKLNKTVMTLGKLTWKRTSLHMKSWSRHQDCPLIKNQNQLRSNISIAMRAPPCSEFHHLQHPTWRTDSEFPPRWTTIHQNKNRQKKTNSPPNDFILHPNLYVESFFSLRSLALSTLSTMTFIVKNCQKIKIVNNESCSRLKSANSHPWRKHQQQKTTKI